MGGLLVAHGGGAFDDDPEVFAQLPADGGLVTGTPSIRYRGVSVGEVSDIDSGGGGARITLRLAENQMSRIPSSVGVRVVPRTLFGDVYVDLVVPEGVPVSTSGLQPGDKLPVDTSDEAVQLYSLYTEVNVLIDRLEPQKAQQALTALSTALEGRGDDIGRMIDRSVEITEALSPLIESSLASADQVAEIADDIAAATPDMIAGVGAATRVSRTVLDREDSFSSILDASIGLTDSGSVFLQDNEKRIITVTHNGDRVLETVAQGRAGLSRTLEGLDTFGEKGARIFSTGKFSITAVPSFADPMPYTAADCPRYPGMNGANCGNAVVGASESERDALSEVERAAAGAEPVARAEQGPNPATTMLLGPLLRGTEVNIGGN